jgi:SAM-dependent methyltransferase
MRGAHESGFGFAEALHAAQQALDRNKQVLHDFVEARLPSSNEPISFDSESLSVLAYRSAIEQVRERYWTTTFLSSGFWCSLNESILGANLRLLADRERTGASVRRLFLLSTPPAEELQRLQDERMLLRKRQDVDELARFDQKFSNLAANIHKLLEHGCDIRIVYSSEPLHQMLPEELAFDPGDTELAIYDDWRFDLFQGGRSGTIEGIRGYTPASARFEQYRDRIVEYFERLWEKSQAIDAFLERIRKLIEYASTRIDYDTSWLVRYDHALSREDESLKVAEFSSVQVDLVRLGRWGNIRRALDVGTCTARYPLSLREAVHAHGDIMAIDNDPDCVRFSQEKVQREGGNDARIKIKCHDFQSSELPFERKFDLITCMMGTLSHFEHAGWSPPHSEDALQRAIENFARLLDDDGVLFFTVWTEKSCRELRLLGIYSEADKQRLARWSISRQEMKSRLEAVGFHVSTPLLLHDRMDLYRCEWPRSEGVTRNR